MPSSNLGLKKRRAEAQAYLDGVAERLRAKNLHVRTHVVVGESTASAVLNVVRSENIDLVAISTRGRSGFKRLLLGSVADKIVRGTCHARAGSPAGDEPGDRAQPVNSRRPALLAMGRAFPLHAPPIPHGPSALVSIAAAGRFSLPASIAVNGYCTNRCTSYAAPG